jgi:Domain of unknown function (DUF4105)
MAAKHAAPNAGGRPPHRGVGRTVARAAMLLLMALALAALTGWGAFAIYLGDSHTGSVQTGLAGAFGLAGIATILGMLQPRWRRRLAGGFLVLFVAVLAWWFSIAPSNDRAWQPEVAQTPYATIDGDLVTVHNIRNFDYRAESDFTSAYYTRTYDLSKLDSVDLFAVYWMGPAIAHTIVSFGFGGEDYLAVSIEARKEQGEGYSSLKGFFRQYELIYIVADERDVVRLRTNYRRDPPEDTYLYRLKGPKENARRFFLDYIKAINDIRQHPRFYNTLTANCTNVIWLHARVNPGHVPFSWKVLVSGYLPEYLYSVGRLDTTLPFAELMQRGHVNRAAQAADQAPDFSRMIRVGVPGGAVGD